MDIAVKDQVYYLEVLVTDVYGNGVSGLDISYEIFRSHDDVLVSSGNLVDLGSVSIGVYKKGIQFSDLGQHRIIYRLINDVQQGSYPDTIESINVVEESIESTVQTIKDKVNSIQEIESGEWEIINNQMIFYDSSGTVEIMRFDLLDQDGKPSMVNVFKRKRV